MTHPYVVIDKRTGKRITKRKWKGVEFEAMHGNITHISYTGKVKIDFDQSMLQQNISEINNETLSISIIPFEIKDYAGDDYNKSRSETKLNFTWNCTAFNSFSMEIQFIFKDPLYISFGGRDIL